MSALELIKQGILAGDMTKISKGYSMITGEKLEPSQITDEHVQKLKTVFSDLQGKHHTSTETDSPARPEPSPTSLEGTFSPLPDDYENDLPSEELIEEQNFSEQPVDDGAFSANSVDEEPVLENSLILPGPTMANKTKLILPTNFNEQPLDGSDSTPTGGRQCSRVQFQIKKRVNKFVDNKAYAAEDTLLFDNKVRSKNSIAAHKFIQKRPPDVGVIVTCRGCNRRYKISSKMAPGRLEGDDKTTYQCDGCILRNRGR